MILWLLACVGPKDTGEPDGGLITDFAATLAKIETVVQVRWHTDLPTTGVVTATYDGPDRVLTDSTPATDHVVNVVGLPPVSDVEITLVVTTEDGTEETATAATTTGASPAWVPDFTYSADVPDQSEGGFTIAPVILPMGGGAVALDEAGRVVWAWPADDAPDAASPYRARLSLDGTHLLVNHSATAVDKPAPIFRTSLDGSATDEVDIPGGHTDFVEYTPGGYLMLGWEIRGYDDRKILGDTVLELAPDGTLRTVWNVFDHFTPDLTRTYGHSYVDDPVVEDWSHINGINYDPVDDAIYVSATFDNGIFNIDRASGDLNWVLSDREGDFTPVGGSGLVVELPHSVQPIDGGVLVFNRGNLSNAESCSEATDIALDLDAGTATRGWHHADSECLLVSFLGDAERLPGGNTLIAWTSSGQVDEVTPAGEVAWRVNAPLGAAVGFSERVPRLGAAPE